MFAATALVLSLQPYLGVGSGNLDWSLAGGPDASASPNVLSELKFENLITAYTGVEGEILWQLGDSNWVLLAQARGEYGGMFAGDMEDADYYGDNRTDLFSLSTAEVAGDAVSDGEAGLGARWQFAQGRHAIGLLWGGYANNRKINFKDGRQLVADPAAFGGIPLHALDQDLRENLDSDYLTEWRGNWLALDYVWQGQNWSAGWRGQLYKGTYYGEGRWNRRITGANAFQQPKSFAHFADAGGFAVQLDVGWQLSESAKLNLGLSHTQWETDPGYVITYFATVLPQLNYFNGANWNQTQLEVGLKLTL